MTSAFGGQHSIQLSSGPIVDGPRLPESREFLGGVRLGSLCRYRRQRNLARHGSLVARRCWGDRRVMVVVEIQAIGASSLRTCLAGEQQIKTVASPGFGPIHQTALRS